MGNLLAIERGVLEWLEHQGAPSIGASEAACREIVTVFVPVNDVALTNVDEEALVLDEARAAFAQAGSSDDHKGVKRTGAAVRNAENALQKAVARAIQVPAKPPDSRYGSRLLPDQRGRQPRAFPSVTPIDPRVTYLWPDASPSNEQRLHLDALLGRVVRLGHSSSLVSVRIVDSRPIPTLVPASDGEATLRTVDKGQLAALERAFDRHREIEPRVMPALTQIYSRSAPATTTRLVQSSFSDDWLVLRRIDGPHLPMTAAAGVARAVRKTLMSYTDDPVPEVVSGHMADGRPAQSNHLAIAPLPFVGNPHASGAVLGIALILPRSAGASERRAVYSAVARWEAAFRQEDEDTPAVKLNLGRAGELRLERVDEQTVQATLRPAVWCGPSKTWLSATPVALDRNPGDLRSRDRRELSAAVREATGTIVRACVRIGLPEPAAVEILPAAPWAGAAKARQYPSYPAEAGRTQRVLTHVRLRFNENVGGPVLIGAGRYVGLGLFKPEILQ